MSPLLGWYVTHVPPNPEYQLKKAKEELEALKLGYKEEIATGNVYRNEPWVRRIRYLSRLISNLERRLAYDKSKK